MAHNARRISDLARRACRRSLTRTIDVARRPCLNGGISRRIRRHALRVCYAAPWRASSNCSSRAGQTWAPAPDLFFSTCRMNVIAAFARRQRRANFWRSAGRVLAHGRDIQNQQTGGLLALISIAYCWRTACARLAITARAK